MSRDFVHAGRVAMAFAALALVVFAQSDRGTITGTISDSGGAVIAGATISVRNTQTGAVYETVTTDTGNYTVGQLPVAPYDLTVTSPGFTKYIQQGIRVQVAQILRVDAMLQVGSTQEAVTVTADAPLLRTDSADVSTNISMDRIAQLPLYGARAGDAGIRSPYAAIRLVPGATLEMVGGGNNNVRVNGMPNNTYQVRIEGQESTNAYSPQYPTGTQPGVDALEEVSFQTSNYAAEYGQVGGGLINFTSKSGTNQLHGSAFEYLTNEFLNAGRPFTNDGQGNLLRPRSRGNVYGGSIGGPVYIPKLYDGRNKTFFFFNIERSPSSSAGGSTFRTVPTEAFRRGDFSSILTGRVLGTDPLGRSIMENAIYDPATRRLAPNGQVVTDPFPNNIIPVSRFDPVSAKIQAMIPTPINSGLVNNWLPQPATRNINALTTFKADHNLNEKAKMSFYLSWRTASGGSIIPGYGQDGMPTPLSNARNGALNSPTVRVNYDRIFTPTTLLHVGVGFIRHLQPDVALDDVLNYDAPGQLGLVGGIVTDFAGTPATGFPRINNIGSSFGGYDSNLGPTNANYYYMIKPTWVVSLSHVRSNHSFKFGAEWRKEAFTDRNVRGTQGIYNFSTAQTGLPSTDGQNLSGGTTGHGYASFLLGGADSASVSTQQDPQFRKTAWGVYAQDSWKVTRKLTVDYGLRYDIQTALTELHDRLAVFAPTVVNPSAGNRLGGMAYAGEGPGRIGGQFTKTYPFAFGPRLGAAWQIAPQTVLRAGAGITYSQTAGYSWISNTPIVGVGWNNLLFNSTSFGEPAVNFRDGLQYDPAQLNAVSLNPGIIPATGQIQAPPYWIDPNGGRPARIAQWSVSLQHQIGSNLSVEVGYVGNRSVWNQAASQNDLNALTPGLISAAGLDINNAADRSLLTSRLDSALAISRGFSAGPYAGYPRSTTVAQSLRPYPQSPNIPVRWSPLGNSWYDSLQAKVTKRYSHGLEFTSAFTWQKELSLGDAAANDVFNRQNQKTISPSSLPFILATAVNYQSPRAGSSRWMQALTGDWNLGLILRYQSGLPILVPAAQNALSSLLFRGTFANRVPGEPLFLKDLNCHCFDPNKEFVLNPNAWSDPGPGQWGTSAAYYNDYRYQRRPDEQISFGRAFRIKERMSFTVRAMFYNMFNRTYPVDPDSTNARATQVTNASGNVVSGFGRINTGSSYLVGQRTGRLEARFVF